MRRFLGHRGIVWAALLGATCLSSCRSGTTETSEGSATFRVVVGRNEGRAWRIDDVNLHVPQEVTVGRDGVARFKFPKAYRPASETIDGREYEGIVATGEGKRSVKALAAVDADGAALLVTDSTFPIRLTVAFPSVGRPAEVTREIPSGRNQLRVERP